MDLKYPPTKVSICGTGNSICKDLAMMVHQLHILLIICWSNVFQFRLIWGVSNGLRICNCSRWVIKHSLRSLSSRLPIFSNLSLFINSWTCFHLRVPLAISDKPESSPVVISQPSDGLLKWRDNTAVVRMQPSKSDGCSLVLLGTDLYFQVVLTWDLPTDRTALRIDVMPVIDLYSPV